MRSHIGAAALAAVLLAGAARAGAEPSPAAAGAPGEPGTWSVVRWSDLAAGGGQERRAIHPPGGFVHPDEASSRGVLGLGPPQAGKPPSAPAPSGPAPSVLASFQALGDNNTVIPPDTNGAAGPSHLMVTHNSEVRIQSKAGAEVSKVSLSAFWASVNTDPFDPKIVYDEDAGRFIFTAGANPAAANSAVLLGVSATSDPTGTWYLRSFSGDSSGLTWADYPGLGYNSKWIAVTMNMFTTGFNVYAGPKMWVFDKAAAMAPGAITPTVFALNFDSGPRGSGFTLQPAASYGSDPDLYIVDSGWRDGGNALLRLSKLTGPVASPSWQLHACSYCSYGQGFVQETAHSWTVPGAPQSGSASIIDAGDARLINAVYRNGSVWTTHAGGLPSVGPTRASVFWYELRPLSPPVLTQSGLIDDAGGPSFFWFPSIAVDTQSNVGLGFSMSSANQFAGGYFVGRGVLDPPGAMSSTQTVKAGLAKYVKDFGTGRNRWGDYSATVPEPGGLGVFWTIQEYADTPSGGFDRWGTWWTQFNVAPLLAAAPSGFAATALGVSSISWTWAALAGASTYDVRYATSPGTVIATVSAASFTLAGLTPNTSSALRVSGSNGAGPGPAADSNAAYTLPDPVASGSFAVYLTSIAVTYPVLPASPSSASCAGYIAEASLSPDFAAPRISSSTPSAGLGTLVVSGLQNYATYYLRVGTLNPDGAAGTLVIGSTLTLSPYAAPSTAAATAVGAASFQANFGLGANPAGLEYVVEASTSAGFGAVAASSRTLNLFATVSGLESNTTYYSRVRVSSGPSASFDPVLTLAAVPGAAATPFAAQMTSMTASWTANGNRAGTLYLAELSSSPAFAFNVLSSATRNASAVFTGLDPNTSYSLRARAFNDDAVASASSTAQTGSTLALPPAAAAPAILSVTYSSITVQWTPHAASPSSATAEGYRLEASSWADFRAGILSASVSGLSSARLAVGGLAFSTTYYLRLGALDWDGAASYASWGSTVTLVPVLSSAVVSGTDELVVTIVPTFPQLTSVAVDVPGGALPAGTPVQVNTSVSFVLPPPVSNQGTLQPLGPAVGFDIDTGGVQPTAPVALSMVYAPAALPAGLDPSAIVVAAYSSSAGQWSLLPTTVNTVTRTISATTPHFSLFAPFAAVAGTALSQVQVFPVPWKPGTGDARFDAQTLSFTQLPVGASVELYTILGESLWDGAAGTAGVVQWNGANRRGYRVGSGTYMAVIRGAGTRALRRVVVIR